MRRGNMAAALLPLILFTCRGEFWSDVPAGLVALQTGEAAEPKGAELQDLANKTGNLIKVQQEKDEKDKAEAAAKAKEPTKAQIALKKAKEEVDSDQKFGAAKKSVEAQKQVEEAVEMAGPEARMHLDKLETLVKKRTANEGTLSKMVEQGSMLVKALLRPKKLEPEPPIVPKVEVSSGAVNENQDGIMLAKAEEEAERLKVKLAKTEAKKTEKFVAVLRIELKDAQDEYKAAKQEAVLTKAKARAAQAQEKDIGKEAVQMAETAAKIAKLKEKLARHTVDLQKTKLKAAKEDSRAASSINKRRQEVLVDLNNKELMFQTKASDAREALKAAREEQERDQTQERRAKTLNDQKNKEVTEQEEAAQLKRRVARDKIKMMKALRRSKKGNEAEVSEFDKLNADIKEKEALVAKHEAASQAAREQMYTNELQFAQSDQQQAADKVEDVKESIHRARKSMLTIINKVRAETRQAKRQLKLARESGDEKTAREAADALDDVKADVEEQQKQEMTLMDLKQTLKAARQSLRQYKRLVTRAKKRLEPEVVGKGMKEMEHQAEDAEKIAAEMSAESSTTERLMRMQAKVDVRKQQREVSDQKAEVERLKAKLKTARMGVDDTSRKAKKTAEKYAVFIKAAKMTDGDRVTQLSHKTAKRLTALDEDERMLNATLSNYEEARLKLNEMKAALANATTVAYKVVRDKVKAKTIELRNKKDNANERALKKDDNASYEPKKYVERAEIDVETHKQHVQQANAMMTESQKKLEKEQSVLKHLEESSTTRPAQQDKIQNLEKDVHEWHEKAKEAEKELVHAEKVLESRRHLARVAVAIYKHQSGAPSELVDDEMHRTQELFRSLDQIQKVQNKPLEAEIEADAQKIAALELTPGGASKVSNIMGNAMQASKAGVALNKTMNFISRKLDEQGWGPELKESGGLTRDEYDAQHVAIQESDVENGLYGKYAAMKLKKLLKQVDAGEDPGMPRHGITREQLRASERRDKKSLREEREKVALQGSLPDDMNDLDSIVNTIHEKRGMNREQFQAAMVAITGRRVSLGTPNADKQERFEAADRIGKLQQSWEQYKQKIESLDEKGASEQELDREEQQMQESLDKGRLDFKEQFEKSDLNMSDDPDLLVRPDASI